MSWLEAGFQIGSIALHAVGDRLRNFELEEPDSWVFGSMALALWVRNTTSVGIKQESVECRPL